MNELVAIIGNASVRDGRVEQAVAEISENWIWENGEHFTDAQRNLIAADRDDLDDDQRAIRDELIFFAVDYGTLVWWDCMGHVWRLMRTDEGNIVAYDHTALIWHKDHSHHVCADCLMYHINGDDSGASADWDKDAADEFGDEHEIITRPPEELQGLSPDLEDTDFDKTACDSCAALPGARYCVIAFNRKQAEG